MMKIAEEVVEEEPILGLKRGGFCSVQSHLYLSLPIVCPCGGKGNPYRWNKIGTPNR